MQLSRGLIGVHLCTMKFFNNAEAKRTVFCVAYCT